MTTPTIAEVSGKLSGDDVIIAGALNACGRMATLLIQIRAVALQGLERDAPMRVKMLRALERDASEIATMSAALASQVAQHRLTRLGGEPQPLQGTGEP